MANRVLRDTTDSENVNKLSFHAEVFFYRLMMKADDFGCFHGNIQLVKAALFPLRLNSVRDADIARWITECEKSGLVAIYGVDNKSYLVIVNFNQRLRSMKRRFPPPPDSNPPTNGSDSRTNDSNPPPETETKQKPETEITPPERKPFFRIGTQLYWGGPGEWFQKTQQAFIDQWAMKNKPDITGRVIDRMNTEYFGQEFTNERHVTNSFKMLWNRISKEPTTNQATPGPKKLGS